LLSLRVGGKMGRKGGEQNLRHGKLQDHAFHCIFAVQMLGKRTTRETKREKTPTDKKKCKHAQREGVTIMHAFLMCS